MYLYGLIHVHESGIHCINGQSVYHGKAALDHAFHAAFPYYPVL